MKSIQKKSLLEREIEQMDLFLWARKPNPPLPILKPIEKREHKALMKTLISILTPWNTISTWRLKVVRKSKRCGRTKIYRWLLNVLILDRSTKQLRHSCYRSSKEPIYSMSLLIQNALKIEMDSNMKTLIAKFVGTKKEFEENIAERRSLLVKCTCNENHDTN